MAANLGLYLSSINNNKHNVMRDPEADADRMVAGYPAFIVRRLLSYHKDAILLVNEMNIRPHLDNQLQYEFLLHVLPVKSRFAKLHKPEPLEDLDLVKRFYGYSDDKALEVLRLHTDQDFEKMRNSFNEGGLID